LRFTFYLQTYYNLKNVGPGSPEFDNFTVRKQQIMGTILLEGMEFFAFHGCFKEEQIIGTKFIVDLEVGADTAIAEDSDHLRDTLDYVGLYRCVKTEMEQKSHLLEHLAKRILTAVQTGFPAVDSIRLKIAKINPPMGGKMQQVCYKTRWKR
jgi:7,8-dihydroneopterin aldolase/epimerase/oxygenase